MSGNTTEPDYASDKPIYEEAVDEYLAIVNGPDRLIGGGRISPPLAESPADLIAAVSNLERAEEVTFFAPHIFPARDNPEYDLEMPAGRYLVVPLEADKEDT